MQGGGMHSNNNPPPVVIPINPNGVTLPSAGPSQKQLPDTPFDLHTLAHPVTGVEVQGAFLGALPTIAEVGAANYAAHLRRKHVSTLSKWLPFWAVLILIFLVLLAVGAQKSRNTAVEKADEISQFDLPGFMMSLFGGLLMAVCIFFALFLLWGHQGAFLDTGNRAHELSQAAQTYQTILAWHAGYRGNGSEAEIGELFTPARNRVAKLLTDGLIKTEVLWENFWGVNCISLFHWQLKKASNLQHIRDSLSLRSRDKELFTPCPFVRGPFKKASSE
ncbi:hypothetical protein KFL_001950040 [Klebsormidium nitens]|uniref:Uncharacterized protein n=1 Tax=Klebsormidium nitens TaxID=105231 RepID=A0A1Y1I5Z2_KLENI|nr:hypothetical protein KFL_001950040 [Klebsormidium nitens]|eukprot:GAQ84571.1 hypothetical protein KFL_001950040 [Klebsormidium nitens]